MRTTSSTTSTTSPPQTSSPSSYPRNKYSIPNVQLSFNDGTSHSGDLLFNICGVRNNPPACPSNVNSVGYFTYDKNKCVALSKATGDFQTQWTYEAFNKNDKKEDGIKIRGKNTDESTQFDVEFAFKCDSTITDSPSLAASQISDKTLVITITHTKSCGFEFLGPFSFMVHYKWGLVFVGLIFGVSLAFMGIRIFKYSLAAIGFLLGFCVPYLFIGLAWKDVGDDNKIYFIVGVSLLLACITAYFVYSMRNLGLFIAGCFLGVVIGMEVYVAGLYKLEKESSSVILYVLVVVLGLGIGGLAIYIRQ